MLITADNYNDFPYENETARLMIQHTFAQYPIMSLTIFDEVEISEKFALNIWMAASGQIAPIIPDAICS